jgi:outer membrane protein OmpA-like peptidoglycan-associated protein
LKPITNYFTSGIAANTGEYHFKLRYSQDVWGPEWWFREFGEAYDRLYQAQISRDFDNVNVGIDYVGAHEYDKKYLAPEIGDFDEIRAFVTMYFGPWMMFGGPGAGTSGASVKAPAVRSRGSEAPDIDSVAPQVTVNVSTTVFAAGSQTLTIEPWATDFSGIRSWRIEAKDADGRIVSTIANEGQPPFSIEWDGVDEVTGRPVPEGAYTLELSATDEYGNTATTPQVMVQVQAAKPLEISEALAGIPRDIKVIQTTRGLLISFTSRVLFASGQKELRAGAGSKTLDEVVRIVNEYPDNKISVEGHTDNIGSDTYNQKLSEGRAWSVANYMIRAGVAQDRVKVTGYGKDKPVASNLTTSGREQNRRVEVIILK